MATGRILIVEAETDRTTRLEKLFQEEGYEVLIATNGQQAWDICRRRLPQAILLDTSLPDMEGYKLLRRIRSALRTRHIHVTFLAEGRERRDKIASLEMGADDYILKPYDLEELRLRMRNVLRRASAGNLVDPTTGLPANRLIQEQLRDLLRRQNGWALLRVVVRYLDEFADAHGFLAGKEVLQTIARILSEAVDEWGESTDFIGHSGSDEFIVITSLKAGQRLEPILIRHLEEVGRTHYTLREREQGYVTIPQSGSEPRQAPLLTVKVQMVTAHDGPFHDIMQLTSALD